MSAKKLLVLTLFFMAGLLSLAASCTPPPETDVRQEAFAVLEQMTKTGVQLIDDEIARLDGLLRDVEDRMSKLEQILPQTQKWLEAKKANDYSNVPCG